MEEHISVIEHYLEQIKTANATIRLRSSRVAMWRGGGSTNIGEEKDRISYCEEQIEKQCEEIIKKYDGPHKQILIKRIDSLKYSCYRYGGDDYDFIENEIYELMEEIKRILNVNQECDEKTTTQKEYNGPYKERLKEIIKLLEYYSLKENYDINKIRELNNEKHRILTGQQTRYEQIEKQYEPIIKMYDGPHKEELKKIIYLLIQHKFYGTPDNIWIKKLTKKMKQILKGEQDDKKEFNINVSRKNRR